MKELKMSEKLELIKLIEKLNPNIITLLEKLNQEQLSKFCKKELVDKCLILLDLHMKFAEDCLYCELKSGIHKIGDK